MQSSIYKIIFETEAEWRTWAKAMNEEKFLVTDWPEQFPCLAIALFLVGDERPDTTKKDLGTRIMFFYRKGDTWDVERGGIVHRNIEGHIKWIRGKV
jgi:hypothetical protein